MSSSFAPHAFDFGGASSLVVDYVATSVLLLLLVLHDARGAYSGDPRRVGMGAFGPAISALSVAFAIFVAVRWLELR